MKKGLFVLLVILISGCSEYTEPQESDIAVFERFLSAKPVSSTDDVNIASIYKEGDALFSPVLSIQRQKLAEAEEELQPLVEKGDPEAMFWMAKIIYRSSIKDTPKALNLLQKAAENNPYAAMALFPDNRECQRYFNGFCEEKWIDKAKKLFTEQSKNGDVRAEFYIEKLKRKHDIYISAIIKAAGNNYLYPMVEYAEKVLLNSNSSSDMKKMAISLLRYGRERKFIPAIDMLMGVEIQSGNKNTEEFNALFSEAINLGSNAAWEMMGISAIKDRSNSNIDKYTIAKAIYDFSGDEFALAFTKPIENEKELALANKKAQEMVDAVKDVIYIDGAHPRQD
ncbi:SEL1-like repeat protein [Photobacterium damselae]